MPSTAKDEPIRAKVRKESALPIVELPNTDILEPQRVTAQIEKPDPTRDILLNAKVDPNLKKSKIDTEDPQLPKARRAIEEPM
jgi:hypothetical protein